MIYFQNLKRYCQVSTLEAEGTESIPNQHTQSTYSVGTMHRCKMSEDPSVCNSTNPR